MDKWLMVWTRAFLGFSEGRRKFRRVLRESDDARMLEHAATEIAITEQALGNLLDEAPFVGQQ